MIIHFSPSFYYKVFITVIHLGAIASLIISSVSWWIKIAAIILSVLSGIYLFLKYAQLSLSTSVINLTIAQDGKWYLKNNMGCVKHVTLLGDSLVTAKLLVLNFKQQGQQWWRSKISVVIFPDSLDITTFRRLRVYLSTH